MNPEDEIRQIEEWIEQVLAVIEEMIANGQTLPDELYGQVADAIQEEQTKIDEIRSTIQQPEQPQEPEQPGIGQPPEPPIEGPTQGAPPLEGPPPGSTAQLLWILAGSNIDAFINYLSTYPDPEGVALLRNPSELDRVIQYLHNMMPKGEQPSQDGIQHADINSSNIYGFRYDPKSGRLLVRFQSGSVYGYDGVPPGVFNSFRNGAIPARTNGQNQYGRWWTGKNPSLGASFYQLIRQGGYPYQRVS